jgi:uncharacterized protein (DUF362 family)
MTKSVVSIVRASSRSRYEAVSEAVRRAIDLAGGLSEIVSAGDSVLIKPNLVAPFGPESGACTNPMVCRAIADVVREAGAEAVIAESSSVGEDTEKVFAIMGYDELRSAGYRIVDLKTQGGKVVHVPVPKGLVMSSISTWELVSQADVIISVPVLKTHDQAELTLSLKNLKGLETDAEKRELHRRGVFPGVSDLARAFRPQFAVVDALLGQEGLGPVFGLPVELGLILAGRDLVAVDAVASAIAGFRPDEIPTSVFAAQQGVGTMNLSEVSVAGEAVESVRHRFLRCSEDERVKVGDCLILHADGTCTGCRNTVMSAMFDMRRANQLDLARGRVIVTGADVVIPGGTPQEMVITVGACVPKDQRSARFVAGCPPNNIYVVKAIVATHEGLADSS